MNPDPTFDSLPASLAGALQQRGFTALTSVQTAVLDPVLAGRDLRISSQTGSGKPVAVGLALAPDLERVARERAEARGADAPASTASKHAARPYAVLLAPTRELAAQL